MPRATAYGPKLSARLVTTQRTVYQVHSGHPPRRPGERPPDQSRLSLTVPPNMSCLYMHDHLLSCRTERARIFGILRAVDTWILVPALQ